jgi:hypothetical protein
MLHDLQNLMGTSMAVVPLPLADGPKDLTVTHSVVDGPIANGSSSVGVGGRGWRLRGMICSLGLAQAP